MSALDDVLTALACPHCGGVLRRRERRLECAAGHGFDIARQGYVNLAPPRHHAGDDARMVAARDRFLARGHYRPLSETVARLVAEFAAPAAPPAAPAASPAAPAAPPAAPAAPPAAPASPAAPRRRLVVDLGGGTGHYLVAVLDAVPDAAGVCLDTSAPALRRAARAHPRAAAIGADIWQSIPLRDGAAAVALTVFAPRNAAELERILADDGIALLATPRAEHLAELAALVGGIRVDPRKPERLAATFASFERRAERFVQARLELTREDLHDIVAMGPSARHLSDEALAATVAALPEPVALTLAVDVSVFTRAA